MGERAAGGPREKKYVTPSRGALLLPRKINGDFGSVASEERDVGGTAAARTNERRERREKKFEPRCCCDPVPEPSSFIFRFAVSAPALLWAGRDLEARSKAIDFFFLEV